MIKRETMYLVLAAVWAEYSAETDMALTYSEFCKAVGDIEKRALAFEAARRIRKAASDFVLETMFEVVNQPMSST